MAIVEPIRKKSDLKKIEKFLLKQNVRNYIMFKLGINCGLRISDILKLNISDVRNKNFIQIHEQKTGKFKKFPINPVIKPLLNEYIQGKADNLPLFVTVFNNRMDRITAYRILKAACKYVKIDINVGTHTLRKTFGYHFYKQFKDIIVLQKIFNHSTPNVTLRYIGLEQEEIEKKYLKFIL